MLARSAESGGVEAREFFRTEYRLNHLIASYPKPVITIMDGVTMGGGVGLAAHAQFKLATNRTKLAMPEVGIGFFPDVGGGWVLSRLQRNVGMWMALTGARLDGADAVTAGIATCRRKSTNLRRVLEQISKISRDQDILPMLKDLLTSADEVEPTAQLSPEAQRRIDAIFGLPELGAIIDALHSDASEWAQTQLQALRRASPLSLKVAFRQLRAARELPSFADNMAMEYRIACRMVSLPDFREGVRAALIDKDNAPRWSADSISDVQDEQVDAIFAELPPGEGWSPLPTEN